MHEHIYLDKAVPAAYKAAIALNKEASTACVAAGIDPLLMELVKVRASQINGCAYCLRMHVADSIDKGEQPVRLAVLSAWRDTEYFTPLEQAALSITEEITLVADVQAGRVTFTDDLSPLDDAQAAAISWLAITINLFNRLSIASEYTVAPEEAVVDPTDEIAEEFLSGDNRDTQI